MSQGDCLDHEWGWLSGHEGRGAETVEFAYSQVKSTQVLESTCSRLREQRRPWACGDRGTACGVPTSQSMWPAGKREINPVSKSLQNCKRNAERNTGIEQPLETEQQRVLPENKREKARSAATGNCLRPIPSPGCSPEAVRAQQPSGESQAGGGRTV